MNRKEAIATIQADIDYYEELILAYERKLIDCKKKLAQHRKTLKIYQKK